MATATNKSATKVFSVLNVLFRNFAQGFTPSELARATELSPSDITRYVATLIDTGYAERVPDTDRIRVSVALARKAIQIMQSLDAAERRLQETRNRIMTSN